MDDETILRGYKHFHADMATGSNLHQYAKAADIHLLARLSWMNFWDPTHTIRVIIYDSVKTPMTGVNNAAAAPSHIPIGVVWRDRSKDIEIQLPGNLLQMPFYFGLGSPAQVAMLALAHESFHCGQMDRQTSMNISIDYKDSHFSQAINPSLTPEALELCMALFNAYPDEQSCKSIASVKRLADSALEGQADLIALMAIQHAYPNDFAAIKFQLILARRNAHAIDPIQYDNADAIEAIGASMPASLPEVAMATWRWIASEITLDPVLQQTLAAKNVDIPKLALACEKSLSKIGGLNVNLHKLLSKSALVIGYGKGPP